MDLREGMMRKTFAAAVALLALVALAPRRSVAQFIGYTSAQTTVSTPVNNVSCFTAVNTGPFLVSNIGQAAHFLTLTGNANGLQQLSYTLQGSYDGSHFFDISDVATYTVNSAGLTGVSATGYYPVVAVSVGVCSPNAATITLQYSGISMTPGAAQGTNQIGQLVKNIAVLAPANTGLSSAVFRTPFGSAGGTLQFAYVGGAGPAGSTLTVSCGSNASFVPVAAGPFTLQTPNTTQIFQIPPVSCPYFQVLYTSGGASAVNFNLDYSFFPPGISAPAYQFTHITGTTATAVKATRGFLHNLTVNTGGAGTISVFDLASSSCTGTPATNTVAVITSVAATLQTFGFDVNLLNGICVKASVAMDLTVSWQ